MMRRSNWKLFALIACGAIAGAIVGSGAVVVADDMERVRLRDGRRYGISESDGKMRVHQGKRRAPLRGFGMPDDVYGFGSVRLSKDQTQIAFEVEDKCYKFTKISIPIASLDARLENTAAYRLHREKKYREAAEGFARAVEFDPLFDTAITNLASAYALLGDTEKAEAAVAPLMARNPVHGYIKIFSDPELAVLRDSAVTKPLEVAEPGTARLDDRGDWAGGEEAAYSYQQGWFAVVLRAEEGPYECVTARDLIVADGGGRVVYRMPIVSFKEGYSDDCPGPIARRSKRAIVANRIAGINRFLADFGFDPVATVGAGRRDNGRFISEAKIGVVAGKNAIRVYRKGKEIAELSGIDVGGTSRILYVPSTSTLLLWWWHDCAHNADESFFGILPVPPPPSATPPAAAPVAPGGASPTR